MTLDKSLNPSVPCTHSVEMPNCASPALKSCEEKLLKRIKALSECTVLSPASSSNLSSAITISQGTQIVVFFFFFYIKINVMRLGLALPCRHPPNAPWKLSNLFSPWPPGTTEDTGPQEGSDPRAAWIPFLPNGPRWWHSHSPSLSFHGFCFSR